MAQQQTETGPASPEAAETWRLESDEPISGTERADEIRRGMRLSSQDGRSREQVFFEQVIGKVEPGLKGSPERLSLYLDLFLREFVNDTRLFAIDLHAHMDGDTVVLEGYAEFAEFVSSLDRLFHYLGFEKVDNRVALLPEESLGTKQYAVVNVPRVTVYSDTQAPRESLTQDLLGDPVFLLRDLRDGHYLVHASEGYVGHLAEDAIVRMDGAQLAEWMKRDRATATTTFEVDGVTVPAGARLPVVEKNAETITLALPDGRRIAAPATSLEVRPPNAPEKIERALAAAHDLMGTRYSWGGNSAEGIDCSGLVQVSFRTVGVNMPRDAYMQSYVGALVGTRWYTDAMRAGDTMYFLGARGKITHTGIYLGDGYYIEAAGPGVKITSIRPGDDLFEERRMRTFCFAKRVLE